MNIKVIIIPALLLIFTSSYGQDTVLLKGYIINQFDLDPEITISYNSFDFSNIQQKKPKKDELSLYKVEELIDSTGISDDITYLVRIGLLYIRLNFKAEGSLYLNKALSRYQEELEKQPEDKDLLIEIYPIYTALGDFNNALKVANRIIEIEPLDTSIFVEKSLLYLAAGDFQNAISNSDSVISMFPQNPSSYLFKTLALVYKEVAEIQNSENTIEAKNSFSGFTSDFSYIHKAASAFSHNTELQIASLSLKLMVLGMKLMIPVTLPPPDSLPNFKLNYTISDSLKLDIFEIQFNKMLENNEFKNHYTLYYSLGIINLLQGNYNNAIAYFKQSIEFKSMEFRDSQDNPSSSYNNIITCYLILDDKENAKNWAQRKIIDKASFDPLAQDYIELARYNLKENNFDIGKKQLEEALVIDRDSYEAYVELANIYMLNNDFKRAEDFLNKCYEINPDYPAMYNSIILHRLFAGDIETAKYYINKLLQLNPEDPFALDVMRDFI